MMNFKSVTTIIIIAFTMLSLLSSCKDDESPCDQAITYPTEFLSEETKSYLQNYQDASKIVFRTADGAEVNFTSSGVEELLEGYSGGATCAEDTTRARAVSGEVETMVMTLLNEDLPLPIFLVLSTFPDISDPSKPSEHLLARYAQTKGNLLEDENLMIHYTEEDAGFTILQDSLLLDGKYYYDVISVNESNPGFEEPFDPSLEIAFNTEFGIVYINDKINNRELFYDRKE